MVEVLFCIFEDRYGNCIWVYIRLIGEYIELNRFSDLLNVYICSYLYNKMVRKGNVELFNGVFEFYFFGVFNLKLVKCFWK